MSQGCHAQLLPWWKGPELWACNVSRGNFKTEKKNQFLLKWRTQLKSRLGTHGSGHLLYLQENWGCCWERITPGRKLSRTSWVCKEALATGCKTILTLSDLQCAMLWCVHWFRLCWGLWGWGPVSPPLRMVWLKSRRPWSTKTKRRCLWLHSPPEHRFHCSRYGLEISRSGKAQNILVGTSFVHA